MLIIVPEWAHHFDAFWQAIRKRNLWFIKLRYGAVPMLAAFLFAADKILGAAFSGTQVRAFIIITSSILIYNLLLHYFRRFLTCDPHKFNPLHLSLLQMGLDLTALMFLVYYTGGIESPLYMLFVFHMIIGSLILPGYLVYIFAGLVAAYFTLSVYLQCFGIMYHHSVNGLLSQPVYNNIHYVNAFVIVFVFVLFISVLLANKIAKQLYKMEQDLVESLELLKKNEKEKQRYVMGVVHEIKAPLAALHSILDLVIYRYVGPVSEKIEEKLKQAELRLKEAANLINDVLHISKLRLLEEISFEELDLNELLVETIFKYNNIIQKKEIDFQYINNEGYKILIRGDKTLLELAFSNLLNNAVKYVDENGIVQLKVDCLSSEVKISMFDNGIGIPAEDQEKIFKDFYRAPNVKKSYEGSGLGLSIVKQIIERHNGTIKVESPAAVDDKSNHGTRFHITIPLN